MVISNLPISSTINHLVQKRRNAGFVPHLYRMRKKTRMANFTGVGLNPLLQAYPAISVYPDCLQIGGQNGCSSEVCHPRKKLADYVDACFSVT